MCTRYPIINRVSELKVHIELTRFVQPEKIEIDANERAVNEKSQYCFFVCTTFDSFLNDLLISIIITHVSPFTIKRVTEFTRLLFVLTSHQQPGRCRTSDNTTHPLTIISDDPVPAS